MAASSRLYAKPSHYRVLEDPIKPTIPRSRRQRRLPQVFNLLQKQILRFAQNDNRKGLFSTLLKITQGEPPQLYFSMNCLLKRGGSRLDESRFVVHNLA
ncbi:MAG: hypothetical protein ACRD2G_10580, partial [Terriglobia bacterium]